MTNVLSLNPRLNALLREPPAASFGTPIPEPEYILELLRACRTDAETAHVLRERTSPLLSDLDKNETNVWPIVDDILSVLTFSMDTLENRPIQHQAPKQINDPELEPRSRAAPGDHYGEIAAETRRLLEEAAKDAEASARLRQRSGFTHVPVGLDPFFDALKKAGFAYDFQSDFDIQLKRYLSLYIRPAPQKAPCRNRETYKLVKDLLVNLLDLWMTKRLQNQDFAQKMQETHLLDGLTYTKEQVDAVAHVVLYHCLEHIKVTNIVAFDALYGPFDDHYDSLLRTFFSTLFHAAEKQKILRGVYPERFRSKDAAVPRSSFCGDWPPQFDGMENWFPEEAFYKSIIGMVGLKVISVKMEEKELSFADLSVLSAYVISLEPEFLVPSLRNSLVKYWTSDSTKSFSRVEHFPLLNPYEQGDDPISHSMAENAIDVMFCGMEKYELSKLNTAILELCEIQPRPPTLTELAENLAHLEEETYNCKFPDKSELISSIWGYDYCLNLRRAFFDRLRDAPVTGERIEVTNEPNLWDDGTFVLGRVLSANQPDEFDDLPSLCHILKAFLFDNGGAIAYKFRDEEYLSCIKACLREKHFDLAGHLLAYFLVSCQTPTCDPENPQTRIPYKECSSAFLYSQITTELFGALAGKVPAGNLAAALDPVIYTHRERGGQTQDDYFVGRLCQIQIMLSETAGRINKVPQAAGADRGVLYLARLRDITKGSSKGWPDVLQRHISRIELEFDFSRGGTPIEADSPKRDFPWVVSYFKVVESLMRWRLGFLFEPPRIAWLERANPNRKIGNRFEAGPVRALLQRAKRRRSAYHELIETFEAMGVKFPGIVAYFNEFMEYATLRNKQAHAMGTIEDAEMVRRWVLGTLSRCIDVLGLTDAEIEQALSSP